MAILLAAAAARLTWVSYSQWRPLPDDDAFRYDWFAQNLAAGRGFLHLSGEPTAFWPPGYPLLLAPLYKLFGADALWGQLLNVVLGLGVVALTYLLARRALSTGAALVAAALVALFPSLVLFTAVTLSETAFTFLALAALWLLLIEHGRRPAHLPLLALAGLVLGFAALVRGQALLLVAVAIPFWYASSRDWGRTAARFVMVAAFAILAVAPWTVRNALQMDAFVPISTNVGVDLWIGHHEGASGRGQFADELVFARPDLEPVAREVWANDEGLRRSVRFAVRHPLSELQLVARKLFFMYQHDEEGLRWNDGHGGQPWMSRPLYSTLLGLSNGYYYLVMALAAAGLMLLRGRLREPGPLLLVSVIAYWTAIHLLFFGDPRFHAPAMPLVSIFAGATLARLRRPTGPAALRERLGLS